VPDGGRAAAPRAAAHRDARVRSSGQGGRARTRRTLSSLFSASALARFSRRRMIAWNCFAMTYTGSSPSPSSPLRSACFAHGAGSPSAAAAPGTCAAAGLEGSRATWRRWQCAQACLVVARVGRHQVRAYQGVHALHQHGATGAGASALSGAAAPCHRAHSLAPSRPALAADLLALALTTTCGPGLVASRSVSAVPPTA